MAQDILKRLKANRVKVGSGEPHDSEGYSGDLTIRQTTSGVILYVKYVDKWYRVGRLKSVAGRGEGRIEGRHKVTTNEAIIKGAGKNMSITSNEIDVDKGDLTVDVAGDIELNADGGDIRFKDASTTLLAIDASGDTASYRDINSGRHLSLLTTNNIYFDGAGGHTKIRESGDDVLAFHVGGTLLATFTEHATQASQIVELLDDCNLKIGGSAYFDLQTHQNITSGGIAVDWNLGNKQSIGITGSGYTITKTNPAGPCNLILKVIQGSASADTITTWAASSGSIYWSGGAIPGLSTSNGAIDIISLYFDGTNYFAVASFNFATV